MTINTLLKAPSANPVILVLILSCWVSQGIADQSGQPALNITGTDNADALDGHLTYYYETDATADSPIDLEKVAAAKFKPLDGITINPGQVPYPVWLQFQLANPGNEALIRYLVIGFGYLPYVDVYARSPEGEWHHQASGKALDYDTRPVPHPHYPFELEVPPGGSQYLVRLSSHAPMIAPAYLMTPRGFDAYSVQIFVFGATYFGFTLALFLYKLFLYFFLRDRLYIYFVLFIGFSCLAQLYLMGLLDGVVQNLPLLKLGGGDIFTQTSILFGLIFIRKLFGSYKSQQRFERFYYWLTVVTGIIWVMAILRIPNIHFAIVAEISVFSLVVLYHALVIWRQGYSPAGYFFFGWLIFTFGAIVTSLIYSAVFPFTILTVFVYPVCSSFQALFLSFSLANRIKLLQAEAQSKEILLQRAEARTETKSQFLAQMSHEIRTPMNGVLGMAQLLRETPLNQNQKSLTDILFNSGKNLLNIINDILDFSKLEAGKLRIEKTRFDLEQELEDIASNFTLTALEKSLEFSIHYPTSLPRTLEGDPTRIKQILINLLGNAFKFTEQGSVACNISGHYLNDELLEMTFTVADTGIGISEENQKKLFSAFAQAEDSTTRRFGGTGLGLSICKQLTELMGGEISIASEPGRGSRFIVKLPLHFQAEPGSLTRQRSLHTIAVNLQDARLAADVAHYLLEAGYPLDKPQENNSDTAAKICITDIEGFSSQTPSSPDCKRIILHTLKDTLPRSALNQDNVYTILYTGIPSRIVSSVDDICIHQNASAAIDTRSASIYTKSAEEPSLFSKVLVAEDNKVNQLLTEKFVRPYTQELMVAENGREIVEEYIHSSEECDLILMDCDMPVMDGYEATARIREWESRNSRRPVVIIALSAHVGPEHEQKVRQAGMNNILVKPLLKENLDTLLREIAANRL